MVNFDEMIITCSPIVSTNFENGKYNIHLSEFADGDKAGRFVDILIPNYCIKKSYGFDIGEQIDMLKYCWDHRTSLRKKAEQEGIVILKGVLSNV